MKWKDVVTMRQENLGGPTDEALFEACIREVRALLTLDLVIHRST